MREFRQCDCGSAWFTLAPGETEDGPVAGAVCLSTENEVIAWSGVIVCVECRKVASPQPPPTRGLEMVRSASVALKETPDART